MTKEQIISELKELKQQCIDQLRAINATHDALVNYIAELNRLIEASEKEHENG